MLRATISVASIGINCRTRGDVLIRISLLLPLKVFIYTLTRWPPSEKIPGTLRINVHVVMFLDTWVLQKNLMMIKTAMERIGIVGAGMTGATVASLLRADYPGSKLVVLDKGRGVGKLLLLFSWTYIMYSRFSNICLFRPISSLTLSCYI